MFIFTQDRNLLNIESGALIRLVPLDDDPQNSARDQYEVSVLFPHSSYASRVKICEGDNATCTAVMALIIQHLDPFDPTSIPSLADP